jgi:uncharacterized protein (TIGR02145 family)
VSGIIDNILGIYRQKDMPYVPNIVVKYGYLYNWYAATDARNICADGWHIPTYDEALAFITFLGGDTGGTLIAEKDAKYWYSLIGILGTIAWHGRGSGSRIADGSFSNGLYSGHYAIIDSTYGRLINLFAGGTNSLYIYNISETLKIWGVSIRLMKDSTTISDGETGTYTGNDGNVYRTICIGTQEWLADNLCETKYRDGSIIPVVTDNTAWIALNTGARCSYNNDETNAFYYSTKPKIVIDKITGKIRQFSYGLGNGMLDCFLGYRKNDFALPPNALLNEGDTPLLNEDGTYILTE